VFLQSQNWLERRLFGERGEKGEAEAVRGEEPRRRRAA